ncbi:MAG TPA: hypothetical protein VFS07_04110 [Gemmatimonadales bacterium]|nr:hypothetical protein [Gemmatimonadales bacterium]
MPFRQVTAAGHPALALSNDEVECILVPALGGKVTNLRRRRGREWLWRRPAGTDPQGSGAAYPDLGGWDECFPNIAPGPMPGAAPGEPELPDHGELWRLEWHHDVLAGPTGTLVTGRVVGEALPYEFQRDIVVPDDGAEIRFEYRLLHRGTVAFPFVWAAHPMFLAQPGTLLTLPTVRQVRVDHAAGRADLVPDAEVPWPLDDGSHSWAVPAEGGWSAKLYADIGPSGVAVLTDPTRGEQLELVVDPASVPQVGIWIDLSGGAPRLAVEPCLGAPDRLDRAVAGWGTAASLAPGETRKWTVTVRLPEPD